VRDVETTGLDPQQHTLTAVGIGAEQLEKPLVYFVEQPYREKAAIKWLTRKLEEFKPYRVGCWRNFDVPFVRKRARVHRLPDPFSGARGFIDLHRFAVRKLRRDVHLSDAGRLLGIGEKLFASEDMPALYTQWLKGDTEAKIKIVRHCQRDIELEMGVYRRLREISHNFRLGLSGLKPKTFRPPSPLVLALRPTV